MGQSASPRRRLGDIAASLLQPARPPYYMSIPDASEPAPGWYIVLAGTQHPVYLGANVFAAHQQLLALAAHHQGAAA